VSPVRPNLYRAPPSRQRGWAGIVMILVAVVIVAFVAKEALKGYGLAPVSTRTGTPAERVRAPGASGIEAVDPGAAPVAAANPIERARGVEEMLKQQAAERAARGDGTTQ